MTVIFYDTENINIGKREGKGTLQAAYRAILDLPYIGEIASIIPQIKRGWS